MTAHQVTTGSRSLLHSAAFAQTRRQGVETLLAARGSARHWQGRLSSSALATATAITALRLVDGAAAKEGRHNPLSDGFAQVPAQVQAGARWLAATQLADGSWGDTPQSVGNLSTTVLCWGALAAIVEDSAAAGSSDATAGLLRGAVARGAGWISARTGGTDPQPLSRALAEIYGRDRTFSVPILTHTALCGRFGDPRQRATWLTIPQLPFELAALPQAWFRLVDMQVVSYALPALIAIGQVRHAHAPAPQPLRMVRQAAIGPTLAALERIQPINGGFLEATPLTSFVTMSLAGMGLADHPVARRGAAFLAASMRPDGSWPIDTNLATWCSTLAVGALGAGGNLSAYLPPAARADLRDWLLQQQWQQMHPSTGAQPGGWAWTDLPGGVPDADDTSGALAALATLESAETRKLPEAVRRAAGAGLEWLTNLANRDGGLPTFCRGWGRLPFDTSCPDITAHFLRAARSWAPALPEHAPRAASRLKHALGAAERYLSHTQAQDGSWTPLWFGNQAHPQQANPTYGTAKVVLATLDPRGASWLIEAFARDGGLGAASGLPPSIEETAVAVEALARVAAESPDAALRARALLKVEAGVGWLMDRTAGGTQFAATPIGLYFAKLWYDEELYPLVFTVAALERAARLAEGA